MTQVGVFSGDARKENGAGKTSQSKQSGSIASFSYSTLSEDWERKDASVDTHPEDAIHWTMKPVG